SRICLAGRTGKGPRIAAEHGMVDQEISQYRAAQGSADERSHHRVSQGRVRSAKRNLTVSTAGKSAQERSEWDDRFMRRVWLRLSSSSGAGVDRVFGYCDR